MNPQSYYPYLAYAQSLIAQKWDNKNPYHSKLVMALLELYQTVNKKINILPSYQQFAHRFVLLQTLQNQAICYIFSSHLEQAEHYFYQAYQLFNLPLDIKKPFREEHQYQQQLNFAKLYLLKNDKEKVYYWLEKACRYSDKEKLDIATLYSRLGDYQTAYNTMQGDFDFDEGWDWILFALFQINPNEWQSYYKKQIVDETNYLEYNEQELKTAKQQNNIQKINSLQNLINERNQDIKKFQSILQDGSPIYPKTDIQQEFHFEHFGCLLFGCPTHHNLADDKSM